MTPKLPAGVHHRLGHTKVAVSFPTELFERICAQAFRDGKNFSPMVADLCTVGLLDLQESDAMESAE